MQIGATSSYIPAFASNATTGTTKASGDNLSSFAPSKANTPQEELLWFLKMSPAEKMQYQWLASHKISMQDLSSMSSEDRAALLKQMATELAERAKQNATAKETGQGQQVNILA